MNGSYLLFLIFGCIGLCCCVRAFSGCDAWAARDSAFSCCGAQAPECLGFSNCDMRVQQLRRMQSCPEAYGIVSSQGPDPCPLHWQADSQPLGHQGSPPVSYIFEENKDGVGNGNPLQDSCLENSWTENPEGYKPTGSQRVRHD